MNIATFIGEGAFIGSEMGGYRYYNFVTFLQYDKLFSFVGN